MTKENDIEITIGQMIRELRLEKNLSQEKLAELCNLDRSYYSELERGERTMSIRTLFKISSGLGKLPSQILQLVEGDFEPKPF